MHRNQDGFTLPEILIGLAISSIIIAASFASYIVIKQNYDFQKDMKNISQTSRAVATMIMRDVRMAGYNYDDGPTKQKPEITSPIKITDGGTTAPDSIEIIYDKSYTERLKISYYTKTYNNRLRVYKKVEKCNAMNCAASSLQTVIAESPIADYVDDLQFTGSKNGNTLGTGTVAFGQGNKRWIKPISIYEGFSNCSNAGGGKGPVMRAVDGSNDKNTYYYCQTGNNGQILKFNFDKLVRIEKIQIQTAAGVEGGSLGAQVVSPWKDAEYPYGASPHYIQIGAQFSISSNPRFQLRPKCAWSSSCDPISSNTSYDVACVGTLGEINHLNKTAFNGCRSNNIPDQMKQWAVDNIHMQIRNDHFQCSYTAKGQPCNPVHKQRPNHPELGEISFYGEVFGEPQDPQEVEIGLLIRSPEEHGTSPVAQTFNLGNRPVVTNDNYIRDSYTISALVRNKFYD